jgi:hypothetical protein
MTNTTNPNLEIRLSTVDDDSKKLATIYGTLGTLLALASLAFAVLTWARSRRHKCEVNSGTRAATDRALESNEFGHRTFGPRRVHRVLSTAVWHTQASCTVSRTANSVTKPLMPTVMLHFFRTAACISVNPV